MTQSIAFIVPGRRESVLGDQYQRLGHSFEEIGIKPEYIQPNWKLTSVAALASDTSRQIQQIATQGKRVHGLGFSLGALSLLMASEHVRFETIILCSMSFFREDIPHMGSILRFFTRRILYRGTEPMEYPHTNQGKAFYLVYGERELSKIPPEVITLRERRFKGSQTVIAPNAGHSIAHKGYQATLRTLIRSIGQASQSSDHNLI